MEKLYDYHFRAYRSTTKEFLGEFHWKQITAKEFNKRLAKIYRGDNTFPIGTLLESDIAISWL